MKLIVYLCGVYSVGFAVFHLFFWRLLDWENELKKLSRVNRAVMQILNIRLIHFFLLVAVICFSFPDELMTTNLGKTFMIGISLFLLGRTVEQFVFFRSNNVFVHLLTVLFMLGIVLFALPVFS